jgi:NADH dehydrogenase FAD-containing subunit
MRQIVIIGGGYAGMLAATRMVGSGLAAQVTLIDARPAFVQRIRLHEALAGGQPTQLAYQPLLEQRGIRFVQGVVTTLDPAKQRVVGVAADGTKLTLNYDELVVTLGSRTATSVPGVAMHALRLDDPTTIAAAHVHLGQLNARAGRVLLVGGGFTGIEVASELAERFPQLQITLATSSSFAAEFSQRAATHLRSWFQQHRIALREHSPVVALEAQRAYVSDGTTLDFDFCVWNAGFAVPTLACAAGLAVDHSGRIVVDSLLRSVSHPNIFAAGDAAIVTQAGWQIPTGCISALPMGAHLGDNVRCLVGGNELQPFTFGLMMRCISLGRQGGLVQFVGTTGTTQERFWKNRPAAVVKELINRMTLAVIQHEVRSGWRLYRWPQPAMVHSAAHIAMPAKEH